MASTDLQIFPQDGVQNEIIENGGSIALGDVTTSDTILIETREDTGETSVSNFVVFHDDTTDERRCVMKNSKTIDEAQTACTTSVSIGYVDNSSTRSLENVLEYTPGGMNVRSVTDAGTESISTMDIDGLSFNSDNVGVILGSSTQFRLFYDDTTETLQIQYMDTGSWVTKREFSR